MQGKGNAGMLARGSEGYEEESKERKEREEDETGAKAQDEDEVEYDIGRQKQLIYVKHYVHPLISHSEAHHKPQCVS